MVIKLGTGDWGGSLVRDGGTPESLGFWELSAGWDGFSPWLTPARGRGGGSSLVPLWLPRRSVTGSRRLGDSAARGDVLTARVRVVGCGRGHPWGHCPALVWRLPPFSPLWLLPGTAPSTWIAASGVLQAQMPLLYEVI